MNRRKSRSKREYKTLVHPVVSLIHNYLNPIECKKNTEVSLNTKPQTLTVAPTLMLISTPAVDTAI